LVLQAYGVTDRGRVKPGNEDCFAVDEALQLCIVADGLGGHNAGEIAAQLAVDTLLEYLREGDHGVLKPPDRAQLSERCWPFGFDPSLSLAGNHVRTAIHLADTRILEKSMTADQYAGMGTTIVVALVQGCRLSVGYVGDSRLYVASRGGVRLVTRDDSWMAAVFAEPQAVDPIVARHHPMRNVLTNVVGTRPRTDVHVVEETLAGGEVLLLSTDGVHGSLDDQWLGRLLGHSDDVRRLAQGLVTAAIARGSRDNCTAVVARYMAD
jgi:protein phosphatase